MHVQTKINEHPSGWRIVRQQVKSDWKCPSCGAKVRYYWTTCPNCSHPRPH